VFYEIPGGLAFFGLDKRRDAHQPFGLRPLGDLGLDPEIIRPLGGRRRGCDLIGDLGLLDRDGGPSGIDGALGHGQGVAGASEANEGLGEVVHVVLL
jgi:hypothetical protein